MDVEYNERTPMEALPNILCFALFLLLAFIFTIHVFKQEDRCTTKSDIGKRCIEQIAAFQTSTSGFISFLLIYFSFFGFYLVTLLSFSLPGLSFTGSKDSFYCYIFDICGETDEEWGSSLWVGSLFNSFLKLPPYYDFSPHITIQKVFVPAIYGFYQVSLFCLACVPVFQCRGLIRTFFRTIKMILPIDIVQWIKMNMIDSTLFHYISGFMMLISLYIGTLLWLLTMGSTCIFPSIIALGSSNHTPINITLAQYVACGAFVPHTKLDDNGTEKIIDVYDTKWIGWSGRYSEKGYFSRLWAGYGSFVSDSYYDARNNIIFCRLVGFIIIFFGLTLRWYSATANSTSTCRNISINIHWILSILMIVIATYSRFEIMFQALPTWFFLCIDWIVEASLHTYSAKISLDTTATARGGGGGGGKQIKYR
jgi:hypothetical protein